MNITNRCYVCGKVFTTNGSVKRHLKEVHALIKLVGNSSNRKCVPCEYCNKTLFDNSALKKHLRSVHKSEKTQEKSTPDLIPVNNSGKLNRCLDCSIQFAGIKELIRHLTIMHNFSEECSVEIFSNLEEFNLWLTHIEEDNKLKYIRKKGSCTGKNYTTLYYECNRSGMKPETIMNRKRRQKCQGSQKIGFRCTSHLVVKVDKKTNAVHVKYWKTHYGHDILIQHIRIPNSARKNITAKLALGVSVPNIIDSVRDSVGDSLQKLNRVDIITRTDIHNIKRSFKFDVVDGIRHIDDATSINKIERNKSHLQERIISTALEVVTLASKPVSSEILSSAYKQLNATKSLLQMAEIPNRNDFKFQNDSNNEPSNKKIMKQATFSSTKKKKINENDSVELKKLTLYERTNLKLVLSNRLEMSNSHLNDHTYALSKL